MDNPETPETLGTQDTGRRQSRDTSNIGYTRHRTKTIQRHQQHWAHRTQDEDNPETPATLKTKKQTNKQTNKKTQDRKQNKNKQHEPHQKPAVNPCTRDKTQPMYFDQNVKLEVKET